MIKDRGHRLSRQRNDQVVPKKRNQLTDRNKTGDNMYEEIPDSRKVQRILVSAIGRSPYSLDDSFRMVFCSDKFSSLIENRSGLTVEDIEPISCALCSELGFYSQRRVDARTEVKCVLTEYFRRTHGMTGREVFDLFSENGILEWLDECYSMVGGEDPNEFLCTVEEGITDLVSKRQNNR